MNKIENLEICSWQSNKIEDDDNDFFSRTFIKAGHKETIEK